MYLLLFAEKCDYVSEIRNKDYARNNVFYSLTFKVFNL